jgi:hypothetical protein
MGAPGLAIAAIPGTAYARLGSGRILPWQEADPASDPPRARTVWNRLGIIDFFMILALTYVAIRYWEHIIATM